MNAHSSIIADDLASEIAEVEIADAMDGEELTGVSGWFMRRTLAAKVRIASVFSLGGLAAITTFAQLGFFFPSFPPTAQVLTLVVVGISLLVGFASMHFVLRHIVEPFITLKDGMARLAQGERDIEVPDTHRQDETADHARLPPTRLRCLHTLLLPPT